MRIHLNLLQESLGKLFYVTCSYQFNWYTRNLQNYSLFVSIDIIRNCYREVKIGFFSLKLNWTLDVKPYSTYSTDFSSRSLWQKHRINTLKLKGTLLSARFILMNNGIYSIVQIFFHKFFFEKPRLRCYSLMSHWIIIQNVSLTLTWDGNNRRILWMPMRKMNINFHGHPSYCQEYLYFLITYLSYWRTCVRMQIVRTESKDDRQ